MRFTFLLASCCFANIVLADPTPTPLLPLPKPEVKPRPATKGAAEPEPPVEIRAAVPAKPAVQVRSANLQNTKANDLAPLGAKEQKIVQSLPTMSEEQLRELAELYSRVGNKLMTGVLVAELTRRNPKDDTISSLMGEARADGNDANDDPEADRAEELYISGKVGEAAAILTKLKATKYRGKAFPHQQDLAYALLESGQEEAAKAAFRELLKSPLSSAEEKSDAGRSLASMALEALQAKGQAALTARDARRALEVAEELLKQNPNDPDGVALKAGAMSLTGHAKDAIAYLMDLKLHAGAGPFLHQMTLADAYSDAKLPDAAESAYQEILDQPGYNKAERAEATENLKNLRRDRLVAAGESALNRGNFVKAEEIAKLLESERPVHPDAKAFRASILNKQGRFTESLAILEAMRADPKHSFEANSEIAEAYMKTGRWKEAAEQYSIAENDYRNDDSSRFDAAGLTRELRSRYRPTAGSIYEAESGAEGTIWRNSTEFSSGIMGNGNVLITRSVWDQVHLTGDRSISRQDADRYQAELAYRRIISNGFFGEVSVGASDNDVVYGAKLGQYESKGMGWELSYRGNERATDSLQLEALNGRQNALTAFMSTHFSKRFYLDARVFFRQVSVQNHDLGQGWGLDMNIGCTLLEETQRRPELQVAYFNEVSFFNTKKLPATFTDKNGRRGFVGDLGDQLIDSGINRHGIILTLSKQLNHNVNAYIYGGVSYEFENQEVEGRLGAGIEAYLAPNATFNIGIDYSTSGNAGNRGSDVISGTVGVKMSF